MAHPEQQYRGRPEWRIYLRRKKRRVSHRLHGDRVESEHQPLNMTVMTRDGNYSEEREGRVKKVICWKSESVRKYEETTEFKIFEEEKDTNKDWERLKKQ